MALFDDAPINSLEDVLGQQATNASNSIKDQYAQQRRKLVAQQAAAGRLRSGVSNYNFGDLAANEAGDLGQVQNSLAESLGEIPTNQYLDEQDFNRSYQLAKLIGSLNKPSALSEAFGALGTAGSIAGLGAAFL